MGNAHVNALDGVARRLENGASDAVAVAAEVTADGALGGVGDNAGPGHADFLAGEMLAEEAGDVVVDDDALVHALLHDVGEQADGGAAAADAHGGLLRAVDDGSDALLADDLDHLGLAGLVVGGLDGQLDLLAVGKSDNGAGGGKAAVLCGQTVRAADIDHLGAVFLGMYKADGLAFAVNGVALFADVGVGVELDENAGVAQRSLGNGGDDVNAVALLADDVRSRTDAGIVGARADSGNDGLGNFRIDLDLGLALHDESAVADQTAALVGVALAGAGGADGDLALDGAGMALHDAFGLFRAVNGSERADAAADVALHAHIRDLDDLLAVRARLDGNGADGAVFRADLALLAFFLIDFQHVTLSF